MKRLMVFVGIGCGIGCGATQGEPPEVVPTEPAPVAETAVATDAGAAKVKAPFERRLFPQKYSATSHLENDWNTFQENYLAEYLGDDNPATSWTEGKEDVGLGERVMVDLTPLGDASKLRLEIRNGYQKRDELFARNARAKDIVVRLKPSGLESKHTLTDAQGWQSVVVEQPTGPLSGYEIVFNSVYPGSKYKDLVISDIQTYVTALTPDNPDFETSKQKRLLDWIADRRLAAKTFKEAARGSMPIASHYAGSDLPGADSDPELCFHDCPLPFDRASKAWGAGKPAFGALAAAAQERFAGWKHIRLSTTDQRSIPQAYNFRFPGSWWGDILVYEGDEAAILMPATRKLAFLNAKNLKRVYVETNALLPERAVQGKAPGCNQEDKEARHYFTPDTTGPLRTLLITACGLYEEREGYGEGRYWQVIKYAANGEMSYLFDYFTASKYEWIKRKGAPLLKKVTRLSTGGAVDTQFVTK